METTPDTSDLNKAFSTAIAAWRTGRNPSLQIITQLIEAGYDVDAIAARHGIKDITPPSKVKAAAPSEVVPAAPFNLEVQVIDGEPRVLDTDLAKALGMARPTNIRTTIEANRDALERFGPVARITCDVPMPRKGFKESAAFCLNEEQALYVTMHCRTERANAVKVEVVKVFTAWRRGTLTQPEQPATVGIEQMMAAMTASMTAAIAQAMQAVLQASGKAAAAEPQVKRVIPERMRSKAVEEQRTASAEGPQEYAPIVHDKSRGRKPTFQRDDIQLVLTLAKRGQADKEIARVTGLSRRVVERLRTKPNWGSETLKKWGL